MTTGYRLMLKTWNADQHACRNYVEWQAIPTIWESRLSLNAPRTGFGLFC